MDARSSRAHDAIPFTGLDRLRTAARRTMLQRSALGLAAVALLAVAALTARSLELPAHRLVPESRSGVIVLDLSRSINGSRMGEMADLLRRFAVPGQRVGLVVFSDMAYELLPPGSPGTELRPMIGFLTPFRLRPHAKKLRLPETPWDPHFRAGTRISVGLAAAHQALLRHGRGRGVVMLVSDLSGLPDDLPRVAEEIVALQNDRIPLRIVALRPSAGDRSVFERLAGESAFVPPSSLGRGGLRGVAEAALEQPVPGGLVGVTLVLLAVVALNEFWCGRLLGPRIEPREKAA